MVVMQRVMMEYGLCMYNGDYAENRLSMLNEGNVEGKCNRISSTKVVMQKVMMEYGLCV